MKYEDGCGNEIVITATKEIILKLSTGARRKIGKVSESSGGETILTFPRTKKHIFKKSNSWGLNDNLIKKFKDDDIIKVVCFEEGLAYWMRVKKAKDQGEYMNFKQQGFELQKFVNRDLFVKQEIKAGGE